MKVVATRDADEFLVQEMLAPPPLEQARSSLEFWRRRRKVLPFYRRRERREAAPRLWETLGKNCAELTSL